MIGYKNRLHIANLNRSSPSKLPVLVIATQENDVLNIAHGSAIQQAGDKIMLKLEGVRFGQVVCSKGGEGYQVIRPWNGTSVFVAALMQERTRTQLQCDDNREVVRSSNGEVF